jgi:hypothetical protein
VRRIAADHGSFFFRRARVSVCRSGPMSRAKLRSTLGVSLSTITAAVQDVIEKGVRAEAGHAATTGGRPPVLLDIAPDLGGVLAVDSGRSHLRFGAADVATSVLEGNAATDAGVVMHPRVAPRPSSTRKYLRSGKGSGTNLPSPCPSRTAAISKTEGRRIELIARTQSFRTPRATLG